MQVEEEPQWFVDYRALTDKRIEKLEAELIAVSQRCEEVCSELAERDKQTKADSPEPAPPINGCSSPAARFKAERKPPQKIDDTSTTPPSRNKRVTTNNDDKPWRAKPAPRKSPSVTEDPPAVVKPPPAVVASMKNILSVLDEASTAIR